MKKIQIGFFMMSIISPSTTVLSLVASTDRAIVSFTPYFTKILHFYCHFPYYKIDIVVTIVAEVSYIQKYSTDRFSRQRPNLVGIKVNEFHFILGGWVNRFTV